MPLANISKNAALKNKRLLMPIVCCIQLELVIQEKKLEKLPYLLPNYKRAKYYQKWTFEKQ